MEKRAKVLLNQKYLQKTDLAFLGSFGKEPQDSSIFRCIVGMTLEVRKYIKKKMLWTKEGEKGQGQEAPVYKCGRYYLCVFLLGISLHCINYNFAKTSCNSKIICRLADNENGMTAPLLNLNET